MLKRVCFVLALLMVHSSASACSDLNGDGVVNVADFLILVDDFGKTVTCAHVEKVQLVIQNQFSDAVWDTSRNAAGVLTITITKKPISPPPLPPPPPTPPPVTDDSAEGDRQALMDLYNATGGIDGITGTPYLGTWGTEKPISEWYGVKVNSIGRVDSLYFVPRDGGYLPESLGNLTHLKSLIIGVRYRSSGISGPIGPESLGNLSQLEHLNLYGNVQGPIPESLGAIESLRPESKRPASGQFLKV